MKKFTLLTKHIPTLSCIRGADFANRSYPSEVLNFIEDQGLFLRQGKYYYLKNYLNILESNAITRSIECVTALDVNTAYSNLTDTAEQVFRLFKRLENK